ncbi:MAG: ribosomal protein S18-alanine N-acetyltransferase [Thermodesulfovibrionales bacterium]|nr:ribosomal protein S18-alanine N-acetyltransferase [Thermodesulfovibrionales bacterium]
MFSHKRLLIDDIAELSSLQKEFVELQWTYDAFISDIVNPNCICLKVSVNNQIAGYLIARIIIDECHVTNLFVKDCFRTRGIGSALMEGLFKEISNKGIKRVFLELRMSNTKAIRLYEKFGFRRIAIRKNLYTNPSEDGVFMLKDLS